MGVAGVAGRYIGTKVAVTELPQTVAAFHALVGLAAVTTSIASFMMDLHPSNLHAVASFFGTFIGGVTFTGSIAAFIKLAGIKFDFQLPAKGLINKPLVLTNIIGLTAMILT